MWVTPLWNCRCNLWLWSCRHQWKWGYKAISSYKQEILYPKYNILNTWFAYSNFATAAATDNILVGLWSRILYINRPGNIWLFISIAVDHIVRILFLGVPTDTPTLLICRTIRVQHWRRHPEVTKLSSNPGCFGRLRNFISTLIWAKSHSKMRPRGRGGSITGVISTLGCFNGLPSSF